MARHESYITGRRNKATVVAVAVSSIKFGEVVPKFILARALNAMPKDQSI